MNNLDTFLFGVPVQFYNLSLDTSTLISYFYKLKNKNIGNIVSNEGGWQSENLNLNINDLQPLIKNFQTPILNYSKICKFKKNLIFKIDTMWCNINEYKDYNISHIHPNSLFSGVYYLKTPKDCGNLVFEHPCGYLEYNWNKNFIQDCVTHNSGIWKILPKKNYLFLFPSWLKHYVKPNLNKKEDRISISFNVTARL